MRILGLILILIIQIQIRAEFVSKVNPDEFSIAQDAKYLIYDVNFGEGFNLRRDVYMRIANTVRLLRESGQNYILVLPPWGRLFHWDRQRIGLPWSTFFDVESLNHFVPVVEFRDFLKATSNSPIQQILYLQHYEEGWGDEYIMKFDERKCIQTPSTSQYRKNSKSEEWDGWFFGFKDVHAESFKCVSIQGDSGTLKNLVLKNFSEASSILIDRAETILHEHYGDVNYWRVRRSMRYSEQLRNAANEFRREYLDPNSDINLENDWRNQKKEKSSRTTKGGEYLGVHWRRRDFVTARGKDLPTIEETAKILTKLADELKVSKVYLATDAIDEEVEKLEKLLVEKRKLEIFRFQNYEDFNDGQIAIIDQWICAHAKFFIGSYESTFSFRIQEDREILGFPIETTFNRLCPNSEKQCEQPAKWKIVYN
ncbi:unnamed protein product [Caenorhabditis angaria]|uniref:GDP-fucose protein O-fucosyltransferase 2 n=1 Tax=Caenorhabditis angaria TaxID=860376 RepID=A0A9P1ILB2_9PELO|nr:unnamed protein product [Caenorhabditis angaria]